MLPKVTIVIPCYNEKEYVKRFLEDILLQDYQRELLEVFIVDGGSSDGSLEIINEYVKEYNFIEHLNNKNYSVPGSLNIGIQQSSGEVIMFLDGKSRYHDNYISTLVNYLIELNADNVGGEIIYIPANDSARAISIAECMSLPFGTGNLNRNKKQVNIREVDSVTLGCYWKRVFDEIGEFDVDLLRNQDDELNARLKKNGGRIFQVMEVKVLHFETGSFREVARKFYHYGYFKPLVARKTGRPATLRQLAPPALILILVVFWITGLFISNFLFLFFAILVLHFLTGLVISAKIALRRRKFALMFLMSYLFFIMHGSYGWGYLFGIFRFWPRLNPVNKTAVGSSHI